MVQITETISAKMQNTSILCAFLVVAIHCHPCFEKYSLAWWLQQLIENGMAEIAVPYFYIVSGFLLVGHLEYSRHKRDLCSYRWYRKVVCTRVRTLLLPFAIWNVLWLILMTWLAADGCGWRMPSLCSLGLWPFDCPALVPLWYLRALFVLVLMSPVLIVAIKRFRYRALAVFFIVYAVCCPYVPMYDWGILQRLTRCGVLPVQGFFYFSLGIALRMGLIRDVGRRLSAWHCVVVGFALVALRAWFESSWWSCYLGFAALPLFLYGVWRLVPTRTWPQVLVSASFPVYLLHRFVQFDFQLVFGIPNTLSGCFAMAITSFAVPVCLAQAMRRYLPRFTAVAFGGR